MRTTMTRWTAAIALGAVMTGLAAQGSAAEAASGDDHPDFLWWPQPTSASSRLYVGNLTMHSDVSASIEMYLDPTELTVEKQVP